MKPQLPYSAMIEITPSCNQNCCHCYGLYGKRKKLVNTPINTFSKVLKRLNEEEIMLYMLTGGEPFLRKDLLYAALDNSLQNNIITSINTNATLITEEDGRRLSKYPINHVLISLTSHCNIKHDKIVNAKGAFKRAIEGIKILLKNNIDVTVNMVVTQNNYLEIIQTADFVKKMGVKVFAATPIQPSFPEHKKLMLTREQVIGVCNTLDTISKNGLHTTILEPLVCCMFDNPENYSRFLTRSCYGGTIDFCIDVEGNVSPCASTGIIVGNLLSETLKELTNKMIGFRADSESNLSYIPLECKECVELESCRGGCRVGARTVNSSFRSPNQYFRGPLKKKIKRFERSNFDFINSEYNELNEILGYDILKARIKKDKSGNYIFISPNKIIRIINPSVFKLLVLFCRESLYSHDDVKEFVQKNSIPGESLNLFLNSLRGSP